MKRLDRCHNTRSIDDPHADRIRPECPGVDVRVAWQPRNEIREWLDASAKRVQPSCSFEYAVPLTETVLLANVAFRAARGRKLAWDAAAMRTDDAGANALLDVAARDGWRV